MDNKTVLRARFKEARKLIDTKKISDEIVENIKKSAIYQDSKHVMIFYPLKYEINLLPLLENNKNFYFPKVNGEELLTCPFEKGVDFKMSSLHINEPCSNPVNSDILDLIYVPALAVDKHGYRLGYGGGFYDRFLSSFRGTCIGICYADNIEKKLPRGRFDVRVDILITDEGLFRLR